MKKIEQPLISVIVPIYNVEKYLNECIDSIIRQTYTNLEIILVNDGSTDSCAKICDSYKKKDSRIKVIHKENGGVSSARNIGLRKSNGIYISFVDSDDWIEPNYYEKMLKVALENDLDVVQCSYFRITCNNKEYINLSNNEIKSNKKEYLYQILNVQSGVGFCHMKLYKKDIIKDVLFDENLKVCEDALFNIKISYNINKFSIISDALYNYRINENSVVKKYDIKYQEKYLSGIESIEKFLGVKQKEQIKQAFNNFVVYHVMLITVNYCFHPDNNNQKSSLKKIYDNKILKNAIEKSNYENISITRKITLFALKHKLYTLIAIICKYRQKQNRRGSNEQ